MRKIKFWKNSFEKIPWGEVAGPTGITKAVQYFNLTEFAKPIHYFDPIHSLIYEQMTDDSLYQREMLEPLLKHSKAIHFYHSS